MEEELAYFEAVERLTPQVLSAEKGEIKPICANVDLYSGFVYRMLGLPADLYTPLFAISRMAGWCAHRVEELLFGGRIMRPAYKALSTERGYVPIGER